MKKLIFLIMCAMVTGLTMAQTETLMVTPIKNGEEPKAVMNAIKTDFPGAVSGDLNLLPAKLAGQRWGVNYQTDDSHMDVNYFLITIKEQNATFRGLYDKQGNLISSVYDIQQPELPSEVTDAISKKYPGWTVLKDAEKVVTKKNTMKTTYYAEISKDKIKRSLVLDGAGDIQKDNSVRGSK